jgi:REP element-mobilizing transposase RayT
MNRGARKQTIFHDSHDRLFFISLLERLVSNYQFEIHAYCLMGNHYHLLISTPLGNLSEGMHFLNSNYVRYFNKKNNFDGPLFKSRFKSILVADVHYLLTVSRYIHLNPIKDNFVKTLTSYHWSSYRQYLNLDPQQPWLSTSTVLEYFAKKTELSSYQEYVELSEDDETTNFYQKERLKPVIGDYDSVAEIFEKIKQETLSLEISDKNNVINLPSIQRIVQAVADYYKVPYQKIIEKSARRHYPPRSIAMTLCREVGMAPLTAIAKVFGDIHYTTASQTIKKNSYSKKLSSELEKVKQAILQTL